MSSIDVESICAGGGSIAWVDPLGLLRVGPQSAGSEPGPACYGRGGKESTITDALVLLDAVMGRRLKSSQVGGCPSE